MGSSTPPRDHPEPVVRARHLLLGLGLLLWLVPWTTPLFDAHDSLGTVAPAISLVEDGDFFYRDEFEAHGMTEALARPTATGAYGNHWSPGWGLLLAPGFALLRLLGAPAGTGVETLLLVHATGLALVVGCLLAAARLVAAHHDALRGKWSTLLPAAVFLGSPLVFYAFALPGRAHVLAATLATAFVMLLRAPPRLSPWSRAVGLGAALGGLWLVRPQGVALGLLLFAFPSSLSAAMRWREPEGADERLALSARQWLALLVPLALCRWSGRAIDDVIWGGTGGSLIRAVTEVEVSLVWSLVHPFHGLFAWSPLLALCVVGLALLASRDPRLAVICGGILLIQLWLNGTSYDHIIDAPKYSRHWAGGASFGARRWSVMFPLFVLGLAELARAIRQGSQGFKIVVVGLCVVFVLYSVGLALETRLDPGLMERPVGVSELLVASGRGLVSLGRPDRWWSLTPRIVHLWRPWVVVVAQVGLVSGAFALLRRRPGALAVTLIVSLFAVVVGVGLGVRQTWATIERERARTQAHAQALANTKARTQYIIWRRQARTRAKTGEPSAAMRTYERAFELGREPRGVREYLELREQVGVDGR